MISMEYSTFRNVWYRFSRRERTEKSLDTFHFTSCMMQSPEGQFTVLHRIFLPTFSFLSLSSFVATSQFGAVFQVSLSSVTQDRINILLTQWHKVLLLSNSNKAYYLTFFKFHLARFLLNYVFPWLNKSHIQMLQSLKEFAFLRFVL